MMTYEWAMTPNFPALIRFYGDQVVQKLQQVNNQVKSIVTEQKQDRLRYKAMETQKFELEAKNQALVTRLNELERVRRRIYYDLLWTEEQKRIYLLCPKSFAY